MQAFSPQRLERRFQERLASKSTSPGGSVDRFDLKIWDHEIRGPHEARVLVGYSASMGIPTRLDIEEFVIKESGAQMRTVPKSMRLYPDLELITAEVFKIPQCRPIEDSDPKKGLMIAVTANTFADEKDSLWEVRKTDDGTNFLARVEREDIDAILREREKTSGAVSVQHRPKLASLREAGILDPQVGDHVAFMHQGGVYHGSVTSREGDQLKVALSDKEVEVMTPDVLDVKETTEDFKNEHQKRLIDIFTKIYGDRAFATKLVTL